MAFAWSEALGLRYELFSLEAKEQRRLWIGLLLQVLIVAFSGFMACLCANVLVLILFWDSRVLTLSLLAGGYVILAAVLGLWLRSRIDSFPAPFVETARELRKDAETLIRRT